MQTITETIPLPNSALRESLLHDRFGRVFSYLRIAVNERCNLRCIYCMPPEGVDFQSKKELLTTREINRIVGVASTLGISKIRFTGGEPLLHPHIVSLVGTAVKTPGIESVHLTTNGLLLRETAEALRQAGLHGINISFDTLDNTKFKTITRKEGLPVVLEGLELALMLEFPDVKVNVVAMRGFNDDEITDFVELTREHPLTVRFIELMPFDSHQIWKTGKFYQAEHLISDLTTLYPDLTPVNGSSTEHCVFQHPGYRGKIAVIPAYSRNLCSGCTRVRLTADGYIRNCLYSHREYNLREILRNDGTDREIADLFKTAMWNKLADGWEAQRRGEEHRESMTQIGG
ncbi:MAG: GTP 3',8-cyclase MoaA [FCB group bacterium]|nr:GTP 3',8-cyclase MoaA [FCB group bacterium]